MDNKQPTPGELTIMIAGAVMLLGSFLPFYEVSVLGTSLDWSAWSNAFNLFPVTPLIVLIGVAMAVQIGVAKFADSAMPERLGPFAWEKVHVLLGCLAGLTGVAYLIRSTEGIDRGIGLWFVTLGAIALAVGAIILQRERTPHERRGDVAP